MDVQTSEATTSVTPEQAEEMWASLRSAVMLHYMLWTPPKEREGTHWTFADDFLLISYYFANREPASVVAYRLGRSQAALRKRIAILRIRGVETTRVPEPLSEAWKYMAEAPLPDRALPSGRRDGLRWHPHEDLWLLCSDVCEKGRKGVDFSFMVKHLERSERAVSSRAAYLAAEVLEDYLHTQDEDGCCFWEHEQP